MRGPSSAGNPVRVLGPPPPPPTFRGVGWGRRVGSFQFWTQGTGMLSFQRLAVTHFAGTFAPRVTSLCQARCQGAGRWPRRWPVPSKD